MKTKGSALYQHLEPTRTTVLGCLPPQKALDGEELLLPSQVAARMIVVEDLGFSLLAHHNGDYVVSYVLAGSVASEYEKIAPGDRVSEIDGVLVRRLQVSDVSKLLLHGLQAKPGGTVALLLCRGKESNLVIMARPSIPPVSPSPLSKARDSMMHPDLSEMLHPGDLSMAAQPSLNGAHHLDFGDSILASEQEQELQRERELTSAEIAERSTRKLDGSHELVHDIANGQQRHNGATGPEPDLNRSNSPLVSPRRSPSPQDSCRGVPMEWDTLDI